MDNTECSSKKVSIRGKLEKLNKYQDIQLTKLILVEGQDEVYFFNALLNHLEVSDIEVREVGGKNNFKKKLKVFIKAQKNFDQLKTLAFIRDANNEGAESAFRAIKNDIRAVMGQNIILPQEMKQFTNMNPRIGIFIMPNNHDQGALEDLCLKTIENDPIYLLIEDYLEQLGHLNIRLNKSSKTKVQIFLASRENPESRLGVGACRNYWNFNSPVWNELKEFIKEI